MKHSTRKVDILIIAVIVLLIAGGVLLSALSRGERQEAGDTAAADEVTLSDFNGKRGGVITGSFHDAVIHRVFSDAEISEYNSFSDLITALTSDKIDYFINSVEGAEAIIKERQELTYLEIPDERFYVGAVFPKTTESDKLRSEFDTFLTKLKSDGTLTEIIEYWKSDEAEGKSVDMSGLNDVNGIISFANNTINPPMSFISGGGYAGAEPDIMVRFCREYGYGLNMIDVDTGGLLSGIAAGMYDVAMSGLVITEERKQSANFSVPYNSGELVLITLKEAVGQHKALSYRDYAGKTVGVGTGGMFDVLVENNIPDVKIIYFNSYPDMVTALEAGTVDALCMDEPVIKYVMATEEHAIEYLDEPIEEYDFGFTFPKTEEGRKLCNEFNEFLAKIKNDGTLHEKEDKWFSSDKNDHTLPETDSSDAGRGVLRLAVEPMIAPFVYLEGDRVVGYEVDIAYSFCKEYGYRLEITNMSFDAIIPSVITGMCDFGCSSMTITEERKENVYFSDPDYIGGAVLVIRSPDKGVTAQPVRTEQNFFVGIAESFEKNFIREDRWKLIVEGIGTTCLITGLSAVFGSALAFLVCMFRRTGSKLANLISDIYVKLLQGTPIVVLLMILYYLILGKSGLDAVWVAIIGFTLNFGAYASEIMRSGIESIDGGQREAALALGYNENQAFFKFIFPQAAVRFIPVYKQEIVSLLKSTSIVGYIAIQDLTKMSDIIRSRTYEAFFPLIATSVIYFILAWIISLLLKLVLKGFDKRGKAQ
ncbi:MAG: ABC transporter permease subunit [Ruminiclostridium sp.]|nr:ABC transporter permease subunit [Ruminiclostridium sp.]